jgi:hypothetical protein
MEQKTARQASEAEERLAKAGVLCTAAAGDPSGEEAHTAGDASCVTKDPDFSQALKRAR